ncbi:hypothetical protein LOAG_07619 [Loa loa]|uniref:Uncharacterized protein n=1 Tax=Loa loa TaxID=7209 RepID=A0A1S0TX47_LOALO|nr:hypothetical protein LOAG_07619 [Loa loa]EFO20871.1 hypothetical protein LOAG_07619 [Loa loa]
MTVPKRSHSVHILPTTSSIDISCGNNNKNNSRFNFCRNPIIILLNSFVKRREVFIPTVFSNNMRRNSNGKKLKKKKWQHHSLFLDNDHVTMTSMNPFGTWEGHDQLLNYKDENCSIG